MPEMKGLRENKSLCIDPKSFHNRMKMNDLRKYKAALFRRSRAPRLTPAELDNPPAIALAGAAVGERHQFLHGLALFGNLLPQ